MPDYTKRDDLRHYDAALEKGFTASTTKEKAVSNHGEAVSFTIEGPVAKVVVWSIREGWQVAELAQDRFRGHSPMPTLLEGLDLAKDWAGA